MKTRTEKDSIGEFQVPADAYWGVQTARAVENFPISGLCFHPDFFWAMAHIKYAAAQANRALGKLDKKRTEAILKAAEEVIEGKFNDQFVVDVYQAGAGTSTHMNMNEVVANRANEVLGSPKGSYKELNPNDHVNLGQSTNDVIPTTIRVGALRLVKKLLSELQALAAAFNKKACEFYPIVKSGRTHLQDATPVRLGQEFGAYAECLKGWGQRIDQASKDLEWLGIGGSATGTGLNTHPQYREKLVAVLAQRTGFSLKLSPNLFEAMQSMAPLIHVSNAVRGTALDLIRICNDLRLLSSGPRTGFAEIILPPVQPGSSIMPGKVNPVLPEMMSMVCFQVLGHDSTIAYASQAGQLELNVMMPVIGYNLLQMLEIFRTACTALRARCVEGIQADKERCRWYAEQTLGLATALNPFIGYLKAAEVAKESHQSGRTVREVILEKKVLTEKELEERLSPENLTEPHDITQKA
ncbi:MAG: aspartate ammonia-lyase [Deltaproteobacteria bacterium]|nr:aspartate ammonia-lyase [Deltaproteobacteria bacterium]